MCVCWFAPAGWGGHQAPSIGLRHTRRKGAGKRSRSHNKSLCSGHSEWLSEAASADQSQTDARPAWPHTQSLLSGTAPPPKSMNVVNQCLELAACRLSLAGAATSIISFVATKVCLSQQLLSQQIFVATNIILSGQKTCFIVFIATKVCFFVATKLLSLQNYVCSDKSFGRRLCVCSCGVASVNMCVGGGVCGSVCAWCGACVCVCVYVCFQAVAPGSSPEMSNTGFCCASI